jgi:hypothetical protein
MSNTAKAVKASHGDSLKQVRERFNLWRETRTRGKHIPAHLWEAAVDLTKEYDLQQVANELHVDCNGLKKRLAQAVGTLQISKASTQFVEMTVAPAPRFAAQSECVIQLENARGAKMRVELNGNGIAGLADMCNIFWGAA